LLRANMQNCGALRIDHVMSVLRLWWIPYGETADHGASPRERMGRIGAERLLARIRGEAITPKMLDLGFTLSPGGSI
ncbi:4-alpha-glucanotransferase, partial [Klebsiella variicola]|uniref:4-alpha-glucanotransferase n=1 Tax=Klebsiella variicola TaxID=244366 RepID=UPI0005CBA89A